MPYQGLEPGPNPAGVRRADHHIHDQTHDEYQLKKIKFIHLLVLTTAYHNRRLAVGSKLDNQPMEATT